MPKLTKSLSLIWKGETVDLIQPEPVSTIGGVGSFRLDLSAKCGFGCLYCSSNCGQLMTENRKSIKTWSSEQFDQVLDPLTNSYRFGIYYKDPIELLRQQLQKSPKLRTQRATLQFGILTDSFDPYLVRKGITYEALKLLLKSTQFKIRILTKSTAVTQPEFLELFERYKRRISVGLSCSSLDHELMKQVELRTSLPKSRASAIQDLQEAGISTFGMFCPILPGHEDVENLCVLYDAFNPQKLTELWTEPYTERNWKYFYKNLSKCDLKNNLKIVMENDRKWVDYVKRLAQNHTIAVKLLGYTGRTKVLVYAPTLTVGQTRQLLRRGILFQ